MRVLILSVVAYPQGSAAASRLQKVARGLRLAGVTVRILAAGRQGDWLEDQYGVPYSSESLIRARGRLSGFVIRAIELIQTNTADALYLYGQSWIHFAAIVDQALRHGIAVYADVTEWHPISFPVSRVNAWLDQRLFRWRLIPRLSGVIAISRLWVDYVRRSGQRTLLIPALGEEVPMHCERKTRPGVRKWLVTYVGGLSPRDLPKTMLDAVEHAEAMGTCVRLRIIGRAADERDAAKLRDRVARNPVLASAVEFTGRVDDRLLKEYLHQSDAFLLLRPDSRETRACFPTRLPEFLASGQPTILSDVGDIGCYLEHRRSAWLVPPGRQAVAVAEAFRYLGAHDAEADAIGAAGHVAGVKHFGFSSHGRRLADFMARNGGAAALETAV